MKQRKNKFWIIFPFSRENQTRKNEQVLARNFLTPNLLNFSISLFLLWFVKKRVVTRKEREEDEEGAFF